MPPFFLDTFTVSSNVDVTSRSPDTGTGWTSLWNSSSRFLQCQNSDDTLRANGNAGGAGFIYTADATYPSANYEVQFKLIQTFSSVGPIYVLARIQDQENMYAVRLVPGTGTCQLYKKVSGTWSTLGSLFDAPAANSICKLSVNGTSIKFYDDGVEIASATDSSISAAGKAGVGLGGGAEFVNSTDDIVGGTTGQQFLDDFTVTEITASGVTGSLSKTQAGDTSSATSKLQLKATLSKSQSNNTLSSLSDLIISGATAKAQAGDTLSAVGKITLKASVDKTQDANALSSTADLIGQGSLNQSQDDNTLDALGVSPIIGTLSKTQQADTLESDGVLPLVGDLSKTQDNNVLESSGAIPLHGSLNATQQDNTLNADGTGEVPVLSGEVNVTQDNNELIAFGDAHLKASVNVTQENHAQEALGRLGIRGTSNTTQQDNTLVSVAAVTISSVLDISQQGNTVLASAVTRLKSSVDVTQADNVAAISAKLSLSALLNRTQADNVLSSIIQYRPPISGPGRVDIHKADDVEIIYAQRNDIIYADDINDI